MRNGDEPERRLLDVRPHPGQGGDFLNWRDGRFLMYELLDSLKTRLALPPIEFDRLLPEERVDVAIAPGDAGAASVLRAVVVGRFSPVVEICAVVEEAA